jgi:hypothetical protein
MVVITIVYPIGAFLLESVKCSFFGGWEIELFIGFLVGLI